MTLQTYSRFIIAFLCCQLIGVAVLYGQWTDIAPAWSVQAESGAHVRVADSVVVVATKDSVVVYGASNGARRYAWKPGVEIGGLALETHRDGIVLSTLQFLPSQTVVTFHFYTYDGMLRETDSFEVQRPFDSSKFIDGINAISTSGRYIVFASQQICDRVSKNVVNARGYSVKSVSFSYDETACALMYGGRTYGNHGETVLKHESRLFSLDPLTSGEIFLPSRTIDRLAHFIPGTNLLWNGSEALSFPDWKVVRKMSHGPYGSLADDGAAGAGPPRGAPGAAGAAGAGEPPGAAAPAQGARGGGVVRQRRDGAARSFRSGAGAGARAGRRAGADRPFRSGTGARAAARRCRARSFRSAAPAPGAGLRPRRPAATDTA